jgi:phosphate-selective porin OprO/OprP
MNCRFWLQIALAFIVTSTTSAQDFGYESLNFDASVRPSAYVTTLPARDDADAESSDELREQLERMELRLRELENDLEDRLGDYEEAADEAEDSNDDVYKRLDELEESLEAQDKSIGKFKDTLPGLVYHGHKNPKLQFFGRIHLDYWAFPRTDEAIFPLEADGGNPSGNPQDNVTFRRMRIGVKGDLFDNVFYKYEGEFAGGVASSYRDAFFGFKDVPYLNTVIIGNHKRPYGLDHLNSSRHNIFIERPFIVESFNQDARRLGASTNGISEDGNWNWRFGVWNQELTQTRDGWETDDYQLELAGRIAGTPWYDESSGGRGYLHVGLSGSVGEVNDDTPASQFRTRPEARSDRRWLDTGFIPNADETALIGLEALANIGSLQLSGEYMRLNVNRRGIDPNLEFDGGYVQAAYFLTGEHMPWNRKTGTLGRVKPFENFFLVRDCDCETKRGWGAWQVAARLSWADLSNADVLGGEGESLTLGLNWLFNPYARMQFNYITGQISNNSGLAGGPNVNGDYDIFGVRMMVDF